MAPSNQSKYQSTRHINYAVGARHNPIVTSPMFTCEIKQNIEKATTAPTQSMGRARQGSRAQARTVTNTTANTQKISKRNMRKITKPIIKEKEQSVQKDCSICAEARSTSRSFNLINDESVCQHFKTICKFCIGKLINSKILQHQLSQAELSCPFPNCDYALELGLIRRSISRAAFEEYDKALLRAFLSAKAVYITCISPACGKYFCTEECRGQGPYESMIECPYCNHQTCRFCTRPWASHGSTNCAKQKAKEAKATAKALRKLGAKPCPNCGMNIQKAGGCDHITCKYCRHHFCWICFVPYTGDVQHATSCLHADISAADDPRNWAEDDLEIIEINRLIEENMAQRDDSAAT